MLEPDPPDLGESESDFIEVEGEVVIVVKLLLKVVVE